MVAGCWWMTDAKRKSGDREGQHEKAQAQQAMVGDELRIVDREDGLPDLGGHGHLAAEDDGQRAGGDDEDHDDDRGQVEQEVEEGQPAGRPDQDVGRVPDQGRGPPDVRGQHLGENEGDRGEPQRRGDEERDGHEQDDRRHVVEEGAEEGGDPCEEQEDRQWLAPRQADRPDRQPAEDAGPPHDAGDDHHPEQEEDDVPVDGPERCRLGDDPEQDDDGSAQQGGQRPVDAVRGDRPVRDHEDREGDPGLHGRSQPAATIAAASSSPSRYALGRPASSMTYAPERSRRYMRLNASPSVAVAGRAAGGRIRSPATVAST